VEAVVSKLPFVDAAVVLLAVAGGRGPTLFVFVGPEPLDIAAELSVARRGAIADHIAERLSPDCVPPQIEIFAMYPRRNERHIDRAWLQREVLEGALREREEHPLFRLLDRLRAAWAGPLPETSPMPNKKGMRP
jgi:hypothetical protein